MVFVEWGYCCLRWVGLLNIKENRAHKKTLMCRKCPFRNVLNIHWHFWLAPVHSDSDFRLLDKKRHWKYAHSTELELWLFGGIPSISFLAATFYLLYSEGRELRLIGPSATSPVLLSWLIRFLSYLAYCRAIVHHPEYKALRAGRGGWVTRWSAFVLVDLAVASTKGTTQDTVCSQRQSQMEPLAQVIKQSI